MPFHTPIDGEPAVAEHVAQITETLSGVRSIPVDLLSPLTVASKAVALSATAGNTMAWNADGFWSNAINQTAADARYLQTATAATTYLPLAGGSVVTGLLGPTTTNTRDLGTTALRWRKLWAVDVESTNTPTVAGTALPTFTTADARYLQTSVAASTYLPLAGGNLTGPLTFGGDVTLSRTGAGALRADTHLGVGVNPAAWGGGYVSLQMGLSGALYAHPASALMAVADNSRFDGTNNVALVTGANAVKAILQNGVLSVQTAPPVTAGATQAFTTKMSLATAGTLTLTPDVGSPAAVAWNWVEPGNDGGFNLGTGSKRWAAVYAVAGSINTSSASLKEGITPLDPAACYQAAKDVVWYEFAYLPPAYQEPEPPPEIAYDASDDNDTKAEKKARRDEAEAASKAAHLKMVAETAPARHQRGFVFPTGVEAKDEAGGTLPPVPDLFGLSDRESTTPQADLATLGCAMQEIIRRLEALEARA